MDWNSRRITAILENALTEDRATRDATGYACIDPGQRAAATIVAKEDCILAGLGCVPRILDVYAALDGAVRYTAPLGALSTTIEYATTIIAGLERGRHRLGG